jgi:hypothetical protein
MEAVAVPLIILSNCNPTTDEAGMLNKLAPEPEKDPDIEPTSNDTSSLNVIGPSIVREPVIRTDPVMN